MSKLEELNSSQPFTLGFSKLRAASCELRAFMPDILEKLPPQNLEAEQSLLGSLLIDKDAIIKISDIVWPEDFYKEAHRIIFEAMQYLYEKREPIDLLSLGNRLEEKKELEKVGGRTYLASLANAVPTASNVTTYAKIVSKKAVLRRLINAATDIADLGFSEAEDVENVLDKSEQKLFAVSQKSLKAAFTPIRGILAEAFERIDELHREKGKLRGVPTGLHDLDNLLAGFQKSDLIILAARPSVGKTALALDFARHIAVEQKIPVGIFSLEMSKEQLVDRLLCAQAGVGLWKMRTGRLSDREEEDDFSKIGYAMGILSEAPIYIDDTAMTNIMEIRTKARRLQMEHGLGMIILDYLQLMEGRAGIENRVLEVAEITRSLKGIARELNIPVLALSQLNRSVETRSPAIPKLADLRESGSIEQDADVVMFIYRKAFDRTRFNVPENEKNIAEIHIAKHRNGPTGIVRAFFDEQKVSFRNLAKEFISEEPQISGE
jgi:replicative DNA helicase